MKAADAGKKLSVPIPLEVLREAMHQRVIEVSRAIGLTVAEGSSTSARLDALARHVHAADDVDLLWLLHVAITGVFPQNDELAKFRRALILATPATAMIKALESTIDLQSRTQSALRTVEVVTDSVIVDVDFCATFEHNTGIQRVVRKTLPHWQDDDSRGHRLVAWTRDHTGYRDITELERDRVLHWDDRRFEKQTEEPVSDDELMHTHMVVPWKSTVLLPEVPGMQLLDRLTCLTQHTSNRISLIGYDAIPLVSASTLPNFESERFAHYLTVIKHADLVAGISRSAADEFAGFVETLPSQGGTGPRIEAIPLATEVSQSARATIAATDESDEKLVLCVGSHEPRKNQDAVLFAAEKLFRSGEDFRMVFVGGGSRTATHRFDRRVAVLQRAGMKVESHRNMRDAELWSLFARARFSVFVSLHEGFGLPVAESVALGTPVLTSDFGSLDEVAAAGGCLQVDPRDDVQVLAGMTRLLVDDDEIERLRREIDGIRQKTWREYADELWASAVEGVRA